MDEHISKQEIVSHFMMGYFTYREACEALAEVGEANPEGYLRYKAILRGQEGRD